MNEYEELAQALYNKNSVYLIAGVILVGVGAMCFVKAGKAEALYNVVLAKASGAASSIWQVTSLLITRTYKSLTGPCRFFE